MALLDALRALCTFDPPRTLPPCDPEELAEVLDAHGLAPLASYQLEQRTLGAGVPVAVRERLLAVYQGVLNDNVFKLMTLKQALAPLEVPALLLGGVAWLDWLYPHAAFRPVGDPRLLVRGEDGARFAAAVAAVFQPEETGPGGHTARFSNGQFDLVIQEGLVRGGADDRGALARATPWPAVARRALRPSAEDAFLAQLADVALEGLQAPLLEYLDLRELVLRLPEDAAGIARVREGVEALGLARAAHGALAVVAHYFPEVADRAAPLRPHLGRAERLAVDAVVHPLLDPTRLRAWRGAEAAARRLVAPRT